MSAELIPQVDPAMRDVQPAGPFGRGAMMAGGANVGAVAIEQERAIAEVQGQIVVAQKVPRSMAQARADFMDACKDPDFAKAAFYSVPNRGSGPSIRFAEELARCYGNFQYGHRELSRSESKGDTIGRSEIEVFAWDVQKNNRSVRQITILHVRDTRDGATKLKDQTDIDNRVANVASKQMRGRILALMPKHFVAAGIAECKKTIAGGNDKPISERINGMVEAFKRYGVSVAHIEEKLGHKVDTTTTDELADLIGDFNAIKDGAKPSEYFKVAAADQTGNQAVAGALTSAAKKVIEQPEATPPASSPAPTPAPAPRRARAEAPAAAAEPAAAPPPAAAATPTASPATTAAAPTASGTPPDLEEDVF